MLRHAHSPAIALPALLCALALAACSGVAPPAASPAAPSEFPAAYYEALQARGARVLRIDETRSLVAVTVRRGGSLARLGHDHIVASHTLAGRIAPDSGRADLYLDLEQLSVDEPTLRAEAGLDPTVAQSAIDATRRNMLEKVLDAARHPRVFVQARRVPAGDGNWDLAIRLNGAEHTYRVAVQLHEVPDGQGANGEFVLRQSDFGITPFAVLGGALRVEDELTLRFRVVARAY